MLRELRAAGYTLRALARELNTRGIPTRNGHWSHEFVHQLCGTRTMAREGDDDDDDGNEELGPTLVAVLLAIVTLGAVMLTAAVVSEAIGTNQKASWRT